MPKATGKMKRRQAEIEAALTMLCILAEPGQTLSIDDIADICDCSPTHIYYLEKSALKKLRARMQRADYLD